MRLRTDDDIYRARLVYLGPPGYTLPIQLPYAQYGLFVILVPLYMAVHYLVTFTVELIPAWEIALAMITTSLIFRYVDPDRPARMVIRTALTDWRRIREPSVEQREPRLVASRVRIRDELVSPARAVVTGDRGGADGRGGHVDSDGHADTGGRSRGGGRGRRRTAAVG